MPVELLGISIVFFTGIILCVNEEVLMCFKTSAELDDIHTKLLNVM